MKRFITLCLIIAATMVAADGMAQSKAELRNQKREARKAEAAALAKEMSAAVSEAIESRNWVLEANRLQGKRGTTINVSSSLNFIAIEGEKAYIQLGSNSGMGSNGVGGITIKGTVNQYEAKKDERSQGYYITLNVMSSIGTFDLMIRSSPTGEQSSADVRNNRGSKVSYLGNLIPADESRVYKGRPVY